MYALTCIACCLGARFPAQRALRILPVILNTGRERFRGKKQSCERSEERDVASDPNAFMHRTWAFTGKRQ